MKKFIIINNTEKVTVKAAGWQITIGGYYVFFSDKNETVATAPPTAIVIDKEYSL